MPRRSSPIILAIENEAILERPHRDGRPRPGSSPAGPHGRAPDGRRGPVRTAGKVVGGSPTGRVPASPTRRLSRIGSLHMLPPCRTGSSLAYVPGQAVWRPATKIIALGAIGCRFEVVELRQAPPHGHRADRAPFRAEDESFVGGTGLYRRRRRHAALSRRSCGGLSV